MRTKILKGSNMCKEHSRLPLQDWENSQQITPHHHGRLSFGNHVVQKSDVVIIIIIIIIIDHHRPPEPQDKQQEQQQ